MRLVPRTLRGRLALAAAVAAALAMTVVGLAVVATVAGSERSTSPRSSARTMT